MFTLVLKPACVTLVLCAVSPLVSAGDVSRKDHSPARDIVGEYLHLLDFAPVTAGRMLESPESAGDDSCEPRSNGCGPSELFGFLANCPLDLVCLTNACNVHDICYDMCGVPKIDCDGLFLVLMLGICDEAFDPDTDEHETCQQISFIYFVLVYVFGDPAYTGAQERVCACGPGEAAAALAGQHGDLPQRIPFNDADRDLMPDDWENRVGLDTTRVDTFDDPDGDGLVNLAEFIHGSNPFRRDSDRVVRGDNDSSKSVKPRDRHLRR